MEVLMVVLILMLWWGFMLIAAEIEKLRRMFQNMPEDGYGDEE